MGTNRREFFIAAAAVAAATPLDPLTRVFAEARKPMPDTSPFVLETAGSGIRSLRFARDTFPTNYVANGQTLGHVHVTWRRRDGAWHQLRSEYLLPGDTSTLPLSVPGIAAEYRAKDETGAALAVVVRLHPQGDLLRWTETLRNPGASPVEVGDLSLPLPMHSSFDAKEPPTASVLKHSFISGHGSYLFWMRSNSVGPYLVMTPEPGTPLEYWDHTPGRPPQAHGAGQTQGQQPSFRAYVHSAAVAESIRAAGGRWRQPHTSLTMAPGEEKVYGFQFAWAQDYSGVRDRLVKAGLIDVDVAPGMTVPSDLVVWVAIRSTDEVQRLEAEHPAQTIIEPMADRGGRKFYRVKFGRLGENMLTLHQADDRVTRLEFFTTEPVETLFHKRAAFITKHQVRDESKWYNGLFAEWAMDTHVQLGPDNYDRIKSWRVYEVTCDDPGLSKPAYLAGKNAEFPDAAQVRALDDYIEHFVWGGLQRTTSEKYSYGIYGILDWKQNRDSPDPGNKGKLHIWRPYDYSHIVVMYWSLYKVARDYPGIPMKHEKATYLERAYGTAVALFTVPMEVAEWSAYETGFYNEAVIPQLIDELQADGRQAEAATLRSHWEKKVAFFVSGGPNLFGSEYAFDSTGFESTQAIARYALAHPGIVGTTPGKASKFVITQMQANLFCRGVVEKSYYYYGSDYRSEAGDSFTLTYMSQMGGWAVLDHALHESRIEDATVRLGYASYLSAFALMNTGTKETNYGYWFPGVENDGGSGGGFEPAAYGTTWLGQPHHRGPWYYSSESDLGYCGALRTAATIVSDDPVFGRFCFGGEMRETASSLEIMPRDGVRRRLYLRTGGQAIDLEITAARFVKEKPIVWATEDPRLTFQAETQAGASGVMEVRLAGWPTGRYTVRCNGETVEFRAEQNAPVRLKVAPGSAAIHIEIARGNESP